MIRQPLRERLLWLSIKGELNKPVIKLAKENIKTKADAYFFLKNFCLENLVLINKQQREELLEKIEKECGLNGKVRK